MKIAEKIKATSRLEKSATAVLTSLVIFTVVGFLILPPILKSILQKKLSENLHRQVVVEDIDLNPYVLSLTVQGFVIKGFETSDTFVSFDQLYVNLDIMSLFKWALIAKEIRIERPHINIIRHEETRYNFSDLIQDKGSSSTPSTPLQFSANNIQLLNGSIDILDEPKDKKHKMTDMNITIPTVSNLPYDVDIFVEPLFEAKFNETPVSLKGRTKPFHDTVETIFDIDLKDINVPYYLAYVPLEQNFKVLSGYLDIKGTLSYVQRPGVPPAFSVSGDVVLKETEIVDSKESPVLKLPRLHVAIAATELFSRKVHLSKVSIQSPEINVLRNKTGQTNIETMLPETRPGYVVPKKDEESPSFHIDADKIELTAGRVFFSDLSGIEPFETTLTPINISIDRFSNVKDKRTAYDLSVQTEANETLRLSGEFSVDPLTVESKLELEGVTLKKYSPYIAEHVRLVVTNGSFSTSGNLLLDSSKEEGISLTYKGEAAVSDLASVDQLNADDFVKWKSLRFNSIDCGYNPTYINVEEIGLNDYYVRLIVNPDQKLNLQTIVKEGAEEEVSPSDKGEKTAVAVRIEKVALKDGHVNFSDKSISPAYSADLKEISGTISGLSSEETKFAEVLLTGKLDDYAPLSITGKINPLIEDLFVDLKIGFKDIELSPMTPYAGKYVGYTIEKGKLSLDLKYLIDKRNLDSQNDVFLDQLTFGDKVESPDAVKLPVKLAIALLKNREGEIDLHLPVAGHIDDPEFRVGSIVLKMVMNLLVKAATSPFALLGAVFGGGEELSVVEFDYGRFDVQTESQKKLDTLVKALYDRPSLKLDIEGHVDIEKDKEGLRQYLFDKKLKAQKLKEMVKKGLPAIPVDDVTIDSDEYEKYLKKAYKAEKFKKPKNIVGLAKKLPAPEMEKLILDHIDVKDDDLRLLAIERAQRVKDHILRSGTIEAERIFLVEPKSLAPEKKETLKDSRVDLGLK
jgi:hypothetical protein